MPTGSMDERVLQLLIQLGIDKSSATEVSTTLKKLAVEVEQTVDVLRLLGKSPADTLAWASNLRSVAAEYGKVADAAREAAESQQEASQGASQGGGVTSGGFGAQGRFGSSFAEIMAGRGISMVPGMQGVGRALLEAGDLSRTIDIMKRLSAEAGGVGAAMGSLLQTLGPVTIAVAAIAVLFGKLNEVGQEQKNTISAVLEAQQRFNKEIGALTREEVQQRLETAQQALDAEKKTLAQRQALYEEKRASTSAGTDPVEQFMSTITRVFGSATIGAIGQTFGDMEQKIRDSQKAVDSDTAEVGLLTEAYNANATAARDATNAALAFADRQAALEVSGAAMARSGNVSGVREQIYGLQDKIAAAEREKDRLANLSESEKSAQAADDRTKQLNADIEKWGQELDYLTQKVLPATEATKRWNDASKEATKHAEELKKKYDDLSKQHGEQVKQINELIDSRKKQVAQEQEEAAIQAERDAVTADFKNRIQAAKDAEAQAAREEKIAGIKQKAAADEVRDQQKFNDRTEELTENYMARRLHDWQEFLVKEQRTIQDFETTRLRFVEDTNDKLKQAAADRDVATFIQTEREANKKLVRDQEDALKEDRQRTEDFNRKADEDRANYQRELADLVKSNQAERNQRAQDLADRLAQEAAAGRARNLLSQQLEQQYADIRAGWQRADHARMLAQQQSDFDDQLHLQMIHDRQILDEMAATNAQIKRIPSPSAPFETPNPYLARSGTSLAPQYGISIGQPLSSQPLYMPRTHVGAAGYAGGLWEVPSDNYPALLHRREAVLNASQADAWRGGAMGRGGLSLTIQNVNVGRIASPDDVDQAVKGIKDELSQYLETMGQY